MIRNDLKKAIFLHILTFGWFTTFIFVEILD